MKFTLFAAFLFSIGWMSVVVAGDGRPVPCCLTVSRTNIRAEYIVRYTMQDQPLCPIRAVRFHTKKNKVICSDPNNNWAKNAMRIVDGRKKTKPSQNLPYHVLFKYNKHYPNCNTTNKTPGTETETSTSTPVTPIVTTIKTSGFSNFHSPEM
ncbi:LOW QUALITY PROTEIN: eotaxin-like [Sinocyclocheilus anshuiensis]|uniref:LOW QUALITY PROTEIN: eotaxin-like n=1 Tax=Sinocyclocheilus anshuiensis TaxID=1608454 RepID=UPI0007B9FEB3|nr:PREDICTED: LOW QUALITY PROTEIN: eotaxin-like [Sinocyclocheilus anshuiensis]